MHNRGQLPHSDSHVSLDHSGHSVCKLSQSEPFTQSNKHKGRKKQKAELVKETLTHTMQLLSQLIKLKVLPLHGLQLDGHGNGRCCCGMERSLLKQVDTESLHPQNLPAVLMSHYAGMLTTPSRLRPAVINNSQQLP
jgi:hypothetical protein